MAESRAGTSVPGGGGAETVGMSPQREAAVPRLSDASSHAPDLALAEPAGHRRAHHSQVPDDEPQVSSPCESPGRPPSVRTNRRFTVTKLAETPPARPHLPPARPHLPPGAGASASAPAPPPAAATGVSVPADDAAGELVDLDGWDYGPVTEPELEPAAAVSPPERTVPAPVPGCRCPAQTETPHRAAAAGQYATLQPGLGGVQPTGLYGPTPRQPLLATGHCATLAAGLASSARLQQAVQSRLAAGTSAVHPRLQPSHPLYRRLAAADYNPAHTISYGHSDGRQLTVRRLLDWELPDLHTVRKYTR